MVDTFNRRIVELSGPDFYPTPAWGTQALLSCEQIQGSVWEPACGNGAMSKVLEGSGLQVYSSDLNEHGYGETGVDFLSTNKVYDNVITNPPFNIAEKFVEHGLKCCDQKLILLLRLAFVESASRYNSIFSTTPPSRVWVFSQRLSMYPEGGEVKGGGTTSYAWFCWDKQSSDGGTQLKWIPPGFKPGTKKGKQDG